MKVSDIFNFLNDKFPIDTACDFDNVGLLVGDPENKVTSAVISLDCTVDAIKKAKEIGAELIITHHPVIFNPIKSVLKGTAVYELIANGISVISMHTNLDVAIGGVNDCLCENLGFTDYEKYKAEDGYLLNKATVSPTTPLKLAEHIKIKLGGTVKFNDINSTITNILFCSGSGGNYVDEAIKGGFDALITADVKHNVFIDAERLGIAVFDAGHYNTEDVVINPLKELLEANFKHINFITVHSSKIKTI